MTKEVNRREFLAASAGVALAASARRVLGANEAVGVALIGAGGQGSAHLSRLVKNEQVRVLAVCDVYKPRLERAAAVSQAKA